MSREYKTVDIDPGGNFVGKKYPCILTSELKEYVKYPFEHFNPVQSNFIHFLEDDERNVVVASETSSGKTVCAELFAARAIQQGKKVLYIAPMKALADEKFSDWTDTDHSFGSMSIEIMTGDFKTTDVKKQKLHMADIIILTPEMFNSKCRQTNSNKWLKNSVLIVDEIHLVGLDGRGSAEEVGIVQYYENFPDARALFLSATLPNVDEFGKWISNLTGRPTEVIVSDYRPCNLSIHFVGFPKAKDYASTETRRMEKVLEYIDNKKDEPMIVFVGSKAFGRKLSTYLNELKIDHCFHNADLNRETTTIEIVIDGKKTIKKVKGRKQIEEEFRSLNFNVLIATTTVAWGCFNEDTQVFTQEGINSISEYSGKVKSFKDFNVENSKNIKKIVTGNKVNMKRIVLFSGLSIVCTEDHVFPLSNGGAKSVHNLKIEDKLITDNINIEKINDINIGEDLCYLLGFIAGNSNNIDFCKLKQQQNDIYKYIGYTQDKYKKIDNNLLYIEENKLLNILAGLMDSNGGLNSNKICFNNTSYHLINFFVLSMKRFNIQTSIIVKDSRKTHNLIIESINGFDFFKQKIIPLMHNNEIAELLMEKGNKVIWGSNKENKYFLNENFSEEKIIYIFDEQPQDIVFDISIQEHDHHHYIANGIVTHNCNTAARNVLQCHTKIGPKPLHPADIRQAVGRAGRLGYSNKGDAYVFAPSSELVKERTRIFSDYKIESTLNKIDTLAFHILSYVVDGTIRTKEDFTKWYEKTLAFVQAGTIGEERAEKILGALSRRHMIKKSEDQYFPTKLGGITSRMYMCPFTVYDWFINFSKIKHLHPSKDSPENAQRIINLEVAKALSESYLYGRTHSFDSSGGLSKKDLTGEHYISVDERATEEVKEVCHLLNQQPKPFHKHMAIFFRKLNGETLSPRLNSYSIGVEKDIDRIVATMEQCDSIFGIKAKKKYNLKGYGWGKEWGLLASRIKLGVPMEIIELVEVPGIGRQRAFKLRDIGIKTQEDLSNPKYFNLCQKTIGKKTYEKALDWCKITKM